MLFDSTSSSNQTDSRTAASDKAKLLRGTSNKLLEKGATDFGKAKVNTGVQAGGSLNTGKINNSKKTVTKKSSVTLVGNKGTVTVGDPEAAKTVSDTAKSLVDSFTNALTTQTATNQATLATVLTNASNNKNDSEAATGLTDKLIDTLSNFAAPAPTVITMPGGGGNFSDGGSSGDAISNFVQGKLDSALNPGQSQGGGLLDSIKSKALLWVGGGLAVALGLFLLLKRRRA